MRHAGLRLWTQSAINASTSMATLWNTYHGWVAFHKKIIRNTI
jgi:hypothetical protein